MRFLVILMPLAFVLAAVMTLGRLYRDHEISAALACGIAPRHQTRALLACAIPIGLLLLTLSMSVLPRVYRGQEALRQQAQQEAGMILFTPNTYRRLDDGTIVHTGAMLPAAAAASRVERRKLRRIASNIRLVARKTARVSRMR